MNLTRCENGHFYDGEKFSSCPHCQEGKGFGDSPTEMFDPDAESMVTEANVTPMMASPVMNQNATVDMQNDGTLPLGGISADEPTVSMGKTESNLTTPWPGAGGVTDNPSNISGFDDDDDDHTQQYYDAFEVPTEAQVVAPATQPNTQKKSSASSPCVGWLVAIGGSHIGQDFHLKVGKNFIGRDGKMDIALTGDRSVSRDKQAIIIYEPKQHLYLVQPGEASSLVYCNNEVVLNPVQLKAYDIITVGEVNLLFVPLCGEQFNWDEVLSNRKE